MLLTSKDANKILKQLFEELSSLEIKEENSKTFIAATTEIVETLRPDYNYKEVQNKEIEIENKIRKIKHAINLFNTTIIVDGFDKTIDEMLIYIPQLTKRVSKLKEMKDNPKMRRDVNKYSYRIIIDYIYVNYDIEEAAKDYLKSEEELIKAQIALDKVNINKTFEVNLD